MLLKDVYAQVGVQSSITAELFAAIFDTEENLVSCGFTTVNSNTNEYEVSIGCTLESNKQYTARLFLWDGETLTPYATTYCIQIR